MRNQPYHHWEICWIIIFQKKQFLKEAIFNYARHIYDFDIDTCSTAILPNVENCYGFLQVHFTCGKKLRNSKTGICLWKTFMEFQKCGKLLLKFSHAENFGNSKNLELHECVLFDFYFLLLIRSKGGDP